jgi:hypothetical protein
MKTKLLFSKTIFASIFVTATLLGPAAFAQVKIGTAPTVIGVNSNLEVEATNNKKVIVDKTTGTLKVENKPLAAAEDSIVTRGTDGELHQMSSTRLLEQQKIPITIFEGTLNSNQSIPVIVTNNSLDQRINLIPRAGYASVWNASTKQVTLPSDGYYHFEAGISCLGTGPGGSSVLVTRIFIGSSVAPYDYNYAPISSAFGVSGSQVWSGVYTAGTTVSMNGYISQNTASPAFPANCTSGYFNITKVK